MREALVLQLEKFCYYQHLSLSGGQERPIFACRIVDIRAVRFHVLSRIQDAGLDFTGRTNFIAHHLALTPEEIRKFHTPPVILRDWPGWVTSWKKEPGLLENEDWADLTALAGKTNVPAQTWQRVTGDAVNGYGLLEARAGASFRVDDQTGETVLDLLAESMELLEVRDPRRDFRSAAWHFTFTTSMQEQDNPADFRWRCIHSDNPAANRFAGPDCRPLSAVRATKLTGEEIALARTGRQAPQFVIEPQDTRVVEGGVARLQVKAEGVPHPSYEWFAVDRAGKGELIAGENGLELVLSCPPIGVSRYVARASNCAGDATTKIATLSVEPKLQLVQTRLDTASGEPIKTGAAYIKSEEEIENQRQRLLAENAREQLRKRLRRDKVLFALLGVALVVAPDAIWWPKSQERLATTTYFPLKLKNNTDADNSSLAPEISGTNTGNFTNQAGTRDNSTQAVNHAMSEAKDNRLRKPWAYENIGKTNIQTFDPFIWTNTVSREGSEDNGDRKADNFAFVFQSVSKPLASKPLAISARLTVRAENCGIMMRESTQPNASFAFIGVSSSDVFCVYRSSGGNILELTNQFHVTLPIFLKLSRRENMFIAWYSTNGLNWISGATNEITMKPHDYLVGFSFRSGQSREIESDELDDIKFPNISLDRKK